MKRVVVIGTGDWGKNLVRNFAKLGALGGVYDVDSARARGLADKHAVRAYSSLAKVWGADEIDAVAIATPAQSHYTIAADALRAGKHCFVEKPLALALDDAKSLQALASERGLTLMVGHLLEYHPAVRRLEELMDAGDLGTIRYLHARRLNFGKVRQVESVLWDLAVHDIAVILRLLKQEPQSVSCCGGASLSAGIADTAFAALRFAAGPEATIFASWLYPEKEQKLVVVGSEKTAVFDDVARDGKLRLCDAKVEWVDGRPMTGPVEAEPVQYDAVEPLRAECAHFLEAVESGRSPLTDAEDAIRVIRILTACQDSLDEDGVPQAL